MARHLELSRPSIAQIELGNRARRPAWSSRSSRGFMAGTFETSLRQSSILGDRARSFPHRSEGSGQEAMEAFRDCIVTVPRGGQPRVPPRPGPLAGRRSSRTRSRRQSTRWQAVEQGNHVAADERRRLGLGNRPLWEASPVSGRAGHPDRHAGLTDEVSGLDADGAAGSALRSLSTGQHHLLRRRFSWIHEYAHVLLDRSAAGNHQRRSRRDDLSEVRANSFAASFLMQEEGVRAYLADLGRGHLPASGSRSSTGTKRSPLRFVQSRGREL